MPHLAAPLEEAADEDEAAAAVRSPCLTMQTVLSREPLTKRRPSGSNATEFTFSLVKVRMTVPSLTLKSLTVESLEPESACRLSGSTARAFTW